MIVAQEPRSVARQLAGECLKEVDYKPENGRPVRLVPLRRLLLVKVRRLRSMSPREGAVLPLSRQRSLWDSEHARLVVGDEEAGITSRFTYAHELAHWAARLRLPEELHSAWSPDQVRQFCDEFAGRVLVPNDLLMAMLRVASIDPAGPFQLTIPLIETMHRRLRAPMAAVIMRIDDAVQESRIRITNCAVLVCAGRSAKQKSHYAARILQCCMPPQWFVPTNKRLTTLGMANLNRAFSESTPLKDGFVVDRFTVWNRDGWHRESVERPISYRVYAGGDSQKAKRVMLSLFAGPH